MSTDNILKGRIAECIVEELLREAGFKVFRFGYENVLQYLTYKKLSKQDFYAKLIRDLPDFILVDEKDGDVEVYPLEVKFRKDGRLPKDYFIEINDAEELLLNSTNEEFERILNTTSTWQECLVIIVMPEEPFFKVYYPGKWLKKQLAIKEDTLQLNDGYPFIRIGKQLIVKYASFVKKYLAD